MLPRPMGDLTAVGAHLTRGDGLPGKHGIALLLDAAIKVPVDHRGPDDPVAGDGEGAVPGRDPSSAAILGALVGDPDAVQGCLLP